MDTLTSNGPLYVLTVGQYADEMTIGITAAADQNGADKIARKITAARAAEDIWPRDLISVTATATPFYRENGEIL